MNTHIARSSSAAKEGIMSKSNITVIRQQRRKRTYRWIIEDPSWPGHSTYIAIEGITVTMGDRFEAEGFEQTYSCIAQGFLDGCFHTSIRGSFGQDVLQEVLNAVKKRGWGLRAPLMPTRLSFEEGGSDQPNTNRRAFTPPKNARKAVKVRRRARQAA